jgi:hypothetical protein
MGAKEVAGYRMIELGLHRTRVFHPFAQVTQGQQYEHQAGQSTYSFTERTANAVILATQAPGQSQAGQTHDRAEQIDGQVLDGRRADWYRVSCCDGGGICSVHGSLPLD